MNKFTTALLIGTLAVATMIPQVCAKTAIADGTLKIVQNDDPAVAMTRIKDLKTNWDKARADMRAENPGAWDSLDKLIDASLKQLRADKPDVKGSADALSALLAQIDKTK